MSEQGSQKSGGLSRRDFLKLMGAAGTGLAFAPFVPWGNYMPNPSSASLEKVPVELPDGTQANVKTFPVNHAEVITYPKTGDRVLAIHQIATRAWRRNPRCFIISGIQYGVSAFVVSLEVLARRRTKERRMSLSWKHV